MTIVEKWQLMMSSFADIKAAIIEKEGTVLGGYANYAKSVRSIYDKTEYTPEYTYPSKGDISERMSFLKLVKEEIRQAIIDGGVECDISVPLSEYGDRIREIGMKLQIVTTELPKAVAHIPYTAQIIAQGGKPPYTFQLQETCIRPRSMKVSSDGIVSGTFVNISSYRAIRVIVTDTAGNRVIGKMGLRVAESV